MTRSVTERFTFDRRTVRLVTFVRTHRRATVLLHHGYIPGYARPLCGIPFRGRKVRTSDEPWEPGKYSYECKRCVKTWRTSGF